MAVQRSQKEIHRASSVGVYADFFTKGSVFQAIASGWGGIASTGALGTQNPPYTQALSWQPDKIIGEALRGRDDIWWLSFWTVSWPTDGNYAEAGVKAGQTAARTILEHNTGVLPTYLILDPEGYHRPASTAVAWRTWLMGWSDGIQSLSSQLKPGFYCNQFQYQSLHLDQVPLPAFIAVSPILENRPRVHGGNIEGYIAYYGDCPVCDHVRALDSWGGRFSTVQFRDSTVRCGPTPM